MRIERDKINRAKKSQYLSRTVKQLELDENTTVAELVESFSSMSIQARNIGMAAKIYEDMLRDDERPIIFLGLAGPLIAAGLRKVIRDMIAKGIVDVVVSTGAIIYQDFYQARGGEHFIGSPEMDDLELRELIIDRIYDTLVDEEMFDDTDRFIGEFAESLERRGYSSREFISELAKTVRDEGSILKASSDHGVPIFIPALNDSSIGIGLTTYYARHLNDEKMSIDPIKDNYEMTQIICKSKATSAIYVGGGIPKNYINDSVIMASFDFNAPIDGHKYAIQITTATPMDGGLSGSTLQEAKSWRKVGRDASTSMAFVEASVGLPLIVGYVIGKGLYKGRKRARFNFSDGGVELSFV